MKHFLIMNTSFFGDVLLTSPLIQNLKQNFPDSLITVIVNKPFVDVAKYCVGVDEVISYDKKGAHKGLTGLLRFYKAYKDKLNNITAAFVIYGNERNIILAKLLGAGKIYADNSNFINCLTDNAKYINYASMTKVADKNLFLAYLYHHQPVKPLPMKYQPPEIAFTAVEQLLSETNIRDLKHTVVLCTTSKKSAKDMPIATCLQLINEFNRRGYEVIIVGAGYVAQSYVDDLHRHKEKFIDLVNKTTIPELGALLQIIGKTVSVDTGTMHLSLAVGVPTVCLFYINDPAHLKAWAPTDLYPAITLVDTISSPQIIQAIEQLTSTTINT